MTTCWRWFPSSCRTLMGRETKNRQRTSLRRPCCIEAREKLILIRRRSASTTSTRIRHSDDDSPNDGQRLLYQRDEGRNMISRSMFLFSSMNTAYWIWYTMDFVPALSAADLQVDPSWGYAGLSIGLLSQGIIALYGTSLVSSIVLDKHQLHVSRHSLPFFRVSAPTAYNIGELTMDFKSSDTNRILTYGIQSFRGHLALKHGRYFPLMLEIRESKEVDMNPTLLVELLFGQSTAPKKNREKNRRKEKMETGARKQKRARPKQKRRQKNVH